MNGSFPWDVHPLFSPSAYEKARDTSGGAFEPYIITQHARNTPRKSIPLLSRLQGVWLLTITPVLRERK